MRAGLIGPVISGAMSGVICCLPSDALSGGAQSPALVLACPADHLDGTPCQWALAAARVLVRGGVTLRREPLTSETSPVLHLRPEGDHKLSGWVAVPGRPAAPPPEAEWLRVVSRDHSLTEPAVSRFVRDILETAIPDLVPYADPAGTQRE